MAFSGAGVFSRIHNWIADRDNGIKIVASRHDAEDDGFAEGLSNTICRDGQSTIAAAIPFNAQRITGLGDAIAAADAVNRQTGDARYRVHGACYLQWTSTAAITLVPSNGNQIIINGTIETVPFSGVVLSSAGTVTGNTYYIYAYMVSTTMTLQFSTTAPTLDSTTGILVKTGEPGVTFVGRAAAGTNAWIAETTAVAPVLSWYQRRARLRYVSVVEGSTAATSYALIAGSAVSVLSWADEVVHVNLQGYARNSSLAGQLATSFGQAGVITGGGLLTYVTGSDLNTNVGMSMAIQADGFYEYDVRGAVAAGPPSTGVWNFFFTVWTRG